MKYISKKPQVRNFMDQDYEDKLSADEKEWLKNFNNEYYNGRFDHPEPVMISKDRILKEYARIKSNPEEYEKFKKDLTKYNQEKTEKYPNYIANTYKRFLKLIDLKKTNDKNFKAMIKTGEKVNNHKGKVNEKLVKEYQVKFERFYKTDELLKEELKKYNKYTSLNYTVEQLVLSNYKKPTVIPTKYKTLTPEEYISSKIVNRYNTQAQQKKEDLLNRDTNKNRNVMDYVEDDKCNPYRDESFIDHFLAASKEMFGDSSNPELNELLEAVDNKALDVYIINKFEDLVNDLTFYDKGLFAKDVSETYKNIKSIYKSGGIKKIMYFYHIFTINLSVLCYLENRKTEYKHISELLNRLFSKIIFKVRSNKKSKTGLKYSIPEEVMNELN